MNVIEGRPKPKYYYANYDELESMIKNLEESINLDIINNRVERNDTMELFREVVFAFCNEVFENAFKRLPETSRIYIRCDPPLQNLRYAYTHRLIHDKKRWLSIVRDYKDLWTIPFDEMIDTKAKEKLYSRISRYIPFFKKELIRIKKRIDYQKEQGKPAPWDNWYL